MFTLSIICNFHREGGIAERSVRNLRDVLIYTNKSKNWRKIEIVSILDNTNEETEKVINNNADIFDIIEFVNFGDLADARNYGVKVATHEFILFFDADDFISKETLIGIYKSFYSHYAYDSSKINSQNDADHIAVFPRLLVEFPKIHFQSYVDSNDYIKDNMKFTHCFVSRICCLKSLLLRHPLRGNHWPYGFEDWDLNNRLLAQGVQFRVEKDYVLYYRRSNLDSLLQGQVKRKCIVRNSPLYKKHYSFESENKKFKKINIGNKIICFLHQLFEKYERYKFKKKTIDFLYHYGEYDLNFPEAWSHGKIADVSNHVIVESMAYYNLMTLLETKKSILMVSSIKLNDLSIKIEELKSLSQDLSQCAVLSLSDKGDCKRVYHIDCLILHGLQGWSDISETRKVEILLKAFVNSDLLKYIYIQQSDLGFDIIEPYSSVLKEYNKEMIVGSLSASNLFYT